MDQNLHEVLTKFRIIASLDVGQKIDTKSNELTIQPNDFISGILRKWHNDSREATISYIESLVLKFDVQANYLIKQLSFSQIVDSIEALQGLVAGISTLIKTYKGDKTTIEKLKGIVKDYILITYKKLVYCLPTDHLNEKICSDLTLSGEVLFSYLQKTPDLSPTNSPQSSSSTTSNPPEKIPSMNLEDH